MILIFLEEKESTIRIFKKTWKSTEHKFTSFFPFNNLSLNKSYV